MKPSRKIKALFLGLIAWFYFGLVPLHAVVFYSTGDTNYNTSAPTGALADSGWQWVGYWGGFQGTPIDAHHFLAANHVGGNVGELFTFQGVSYHTVRTFVDSASDLRIWEVSETFPTWAPLYDSNTEGGRSLIVFGRGVTRGAEVRTTVAVPGVPANSLAGWQYGGSDGRLRWGQNVVAGAYVHPTFGEQLVATFDQGGSSNECHLGTGDSSGPVFINDGSAWKLAGIAGFVESGFSTTSGGSPFNAFIFDKRGLFINGATSPKTGSVPLPSAFFATRVSVRMAWITSVLATPLTATATLGDLSQSYDGNSHPVTVTTSPTGLSVSVTYDGSMSAPVNAGTYAVLATITNSGYSGSVSGALTIAKAGQTITFGPLSPVAVGDPAFTLRANASSGLPVTYTSSSATVATVFDTTVTIVGVGSTTITATQAGNTNYFDAPPVVQTLMVSPAQTVAASSDVPLSGPYTISIFGLLLFVTGSLHLRKLFCQSS